MNQWTHIAFAIDNINDEVRIFVNGVLVNDDEVMLNLDMAVPVDTWRFTAGCRQFNGTSGYDFWNGRISDLRVYNYALYSTEVSDLYNSFEAMRYR